ncbi:hypothetical protein SARC_17121 [Sphaeroforma arctica JP610]|uniref:Uncharacterized protein n=1 Tax=Sphaeroforma arctica JP610 TaxID=667725 RepID=A0A0L0F0V6_9EUKA|nr:hypothetical protein SARC_17121 [Sphaeroforma arctica JP610]KNC70355.1 hypothetical protein SARC_17121 [Sphaeroforma arctica JP610]|eukprot:XP_014144257.1 hypothetical protein SARC_17121 [Sphaeroforma arctica JP610]
MDAALDFNLPVPPLWRLERGVDVAAVFDNSKAHLILDTDEKLMGRELTLAAFSANRNGHSFPKLKQKCVWDGGVFDGLVNFSYVILYL